MSAISWIEFAKAIAPTLLELGGDLFRRFNGDAAEARAEIARIRNHGAKYERAHDALMDELERQQKAKP